MMKRLCFLLLVFLLISCKKQESQQLNLSSLPDYAALVDMYMGVQRSSHCTFGPQLPHASICPSPQTPNGADGGYNPNEPIRGFGQLHVTGTGWGRYGQIFFSPQAGTFSALEEGHDSPKSAEIATPYYYAVNLDRYGIKAEIAPDHHSAAYRFTYPSDSVSYLLFDLTHSVSQHIVPWTGGKFHGGEIHYNEMEASFNGWGLYSGGWGSGKIYRVCYCFTLDIVPDSVNIIDKNHEELYAKIIFPKKTTAVNMKVAVSMKSVDNAMNFLAKELNNKQLEDVKEAAHQAWNKTLSKISVETKDEVAKKLFYTALYHSFLMPRDRSGDAPDWDGDDLPHVDDHLCTWDTWRTKYPLMVLINESFVSKTIQSFLVRFDKNHSLNPTFTSSLDGTWKQGGDDAENIVADAMVKGVKGFDYQKAYEMCKWEALNVRDRGDYLKNGWQPKEDDGTKECSATMEYAYNDYCVSEMANIIGDSIMANYFYNRSNQWVNLFNKDLENRGFKGFVAPKRNNGDWWLPIDTLRFFKEWDHVYFYEGNAWIYTLFVPHEADKLIELCGGKDMMIKRLEYGFNNQLVTLTNEPCFLAPFMFTHCNRPDLACKYVQYFRNKDFSLQNGFPDNEDSGAMGSWYVFTSIGIFPNAGQDFYYLIPPAFDVVSVNMSNGKTLKIKVEGNRTDTRFPSIYMNEKEIKNAMLKHKDLAEGGELLFKYE
jgi:putative alpha-1,2-mannosidase